MKCHELRLTGSGGANRVMEAELKRLVMRSPFHVRVPNPRREGDATLLYPFDPQIAWVAACHHRTSSRVSWDLASSPATRLEPLFDDLVPALRDDDRLPSAPQVRFSVEVGSAHDFEASPLQLRGVVKNAIVEALASRGITASIEADEPDVVFVARRAGTPDARRTVVGIDLGLGARHKRGTRVAGGPAPLRETLATQLVMLSRWDARSEVLVDPMAGGATIPIEAAGLAAGAAVRQPGALPFRHLPAFAGLPTEAPDLFPGTTAHILSLDIDEELIGSMVGNLRAAGLTGPAYDGAIVIGQKDVRTLTPDYVARMLPAARGMATGVFCVNPPYGVRIGGDTANDRLLDLYEGMGQAMARFSGWRAVCFVANPRFEEAFGHVPAMKKPATNADLPGAFLGYQF